jgi:electron-transferring-flavoprotein dehydrogenase
VHRETIEFDVVIVGAGPAGLAAACRLGQLSAQAGADLSVCVVEKGSVVGAHILSGAILETRALDELFPDWRERGAPVRVEVAGERVCWLPNDRHAVSVPSPLVPRPMRNHGNYVVSLGALCRWLAEQAEALGCDILAATAAVDVLFDTEGRVCGVVTGALGIGRDGEPRANADPGYELKARYVLFAEGCRGNLAKTLEARFALRADCDPQHYGLGMKEIWQVPAAQHRRGDIVHTIGWPLDDATEGGGFLYHADDGQVYVGLVVALSYRNPHLAPFDEFQRFKQHPLIRRVLEGGQRTGFGARCVNKGGLQSLPKLTVPGGLLTGCDAGFLNPAKIKGTHTAMKSGMLAAQTVFDALAAGDSGGRELTEYAECVRASWLWEELYRARNFAPGLAKLGTRLGAAAAFIEQNLLRSRWPATLKNRRPDHAALKRADAAPPIRYPKPDGVISFDRLSSVYLSNTQHEEDQPCHLRLKDPAIPVTRNLPLYDEPAQRYCPAAVYEIVDAGSGTVRLQINAANCVHCKCCDIKDPYQNIDWVPPEGGGGPNYVDM